MLTAIAGGVATVTLHRPDRLNALTVEMVQALHGALAAVSADPTVRAIVLTGSGRAFCAGADLAVLQDLHARGDAAMGRRLVDGCRAVYQVMRAAPQPILGAINGVAAGGGANLALACDLRIGGDTAKIGQVFAKIGLHPDWGGTYFLPRLVGPAKALELFLSADLVDAGRLLDLGLLNRVVPTPRLLDAAADWAAKMAEAPPLAVRRLKQNLQASPVSSLEQMLDRELEAQLACFQSDDFREGLAAFFEKRTPHFTGQ